jgi:hypothetical protein
MLGWEVERWRGQIPQSLIGQLISLFLGGVVVHTYILRTWETEARELQV